MREADDANIDDLLGDLGGTARAERAKLVEWLLEQGITPDEIRATNPPLLLATRHLVGDDGTYVSAREISENYGVDLELLQRVQRAVGLARVDDPDAVVHMRADGEAAARAQRFVELGLNPDQVVLVVRVLAEGLSHAAEAMRYTALEAIMRPGATELDIAKGSQALVHARGFFGNKPPQIASVVGDAEPITRRRCGQHHPWVDPGATEELTQIRHVGVDTRACARGWPLLPEGGD